MREPAIVWAPGRVAPASVSMEPLMMIDFLPTFSELAGLPVRDVTPAGTGAPRMQLTCVCAVCVARVCVAPTCMAEPGGRGAGRQVLRLHPTAAFHAHRPARQHRGAYPQGALLLA